MNTEPQNALIVDFIFCKEVSKRISFFIRYEKSVFYPVIIRLWLIENVDYVGCEDFHTPQCGELIPLQDNNGSKAVNARDLHAFLGSKQEFANWIKNRIEKYDLVENVDYVVFHNSMKNLEGGRPQIEYALTIDAAKELSMVEGNEKGKQARRYFIACEKKLQELSLPSYMIPDPIKRAEKWIEEEK